LLFALKHFRQTCCVTFFCAGSLPPFPLLFVPGTEVLPFQWAPGVTGSHSLFYVDFWSLRSHFWGKALHSRFGKVSLSPNIGSTDIFFRNPPPSLTALVHIWDPRDLSGGASPLFLVSFCFPYLPDSVCPERACCCFSSPLSFNSFRSPRGTGGAIFQRSNAGRPLSFLFILVGLSLLMCGLPFRLEGSSHRTFFSSNDTFFAVPTSLLRPLLLP